jgi:hypothetical protein
MAQVFITITCGCNRPSDEKPKTFSTIEEAKRHADETGHTLTGQITVVGNTR